MWRFESLYAFLRNCFRVILVESSWIGRQYIANTLVFIFLQCDLLFGTGSHECYALLASPSRQLSWDKKNSLDYLVWSTLDVARFGKNNKGSIKPFIYKNYRGIKFRFSKRIRSDDMTWTWGYGLDVRSNFR